MLGRYSTHHDSLYLIFKSPVVYCRALTINMAFLFFVVASFTFTKSDRLSAECLC